MFHPSCMTMEYLNRELSWIDFNARVLEEACSSRVPLLERLKFIGIVSSNFDEFFMVRVAGLQEFYKAEHTTQKCTGYPTEKLLSAIVEKTRKLFDIQETVLNTEILPSLKACGIIYRKPEECSELQQKFLKKYFYQNLYPLIEIRISPNEQSLADGVSNVQLHIAFLLSRTRDSEESLALIPVPNVQRFVFLDEVSEANLQSLDKHKKHARKKVEFVLIDELIRYYAPALFPDYRIIGTGIFKINRSASMTVDNSASESFIEALEEALISRCHSFIVRMTSTHESPALIERMSRLFQLGEKDVYVSDAPIGLSSFAKIADIDGFMQLKNEKWEHYQHPAFPAHGTLWDSIKAHDILLSVPYQSYKPVIRLVSDAAVDPTVTSIHMTLYRTSKNAPVVRALAEAAKRGKNVTVFVELKARFDEEQNLTWVKRLQKRNVRVVYDLPHLKVHAKLLLIMRQEKTGEQGYVHLSTGNYNDATARLYSDVSLFTVNPCLVADAQIIFSRLCRRSIPRAPHSIITAPEDLKRTLLEYIERESAFALRHKKARIIAKMNSLSHPDLIRALYKASQAGVRIDLNVRGICMLIPGKRNISDNIRVISIIDRYLEHSRIFYFENGGTPEWYLSSADWMPRNLERRVELLFPVLDRHNQELLAYFFNIFFSDNIKAFEMLPDGSWKRKHPQPGEKAIHAQEILHQFFKEKAVRSHDLASDDPPMQGHGTVKKLQLFRQSDCP